MEDIHKNLRENIILQQYWIEKNFMQESDIQKGKKAALGEVRMYSGVAWKKVSETGNPNKDWQRVKKGEEVKSEASKIEDLQKEYESKSIEELVALKKKLYSNVDIESAMSPEEKLLDKVIAAKFSEINQKILDKRKEAKENEFKEGVLYTHPDMVGVYKYDKLHNEFLYREKEGQMFLEWNISKKDIKKLKEQNKVI
jgi:DNA repair exonuclease SbcCD nuclease subunit